MRGLREITPILYVASTLALCDHTLAVGEHAPPAHRRRFGRAEEHRRHEGTPEHRPGRRDRRQVDHGVEMLRHGLTGFRGAGGLIVRFGSGHGPCAHGSLCLHLVDDRESQWDSQEKTGKDDAHGVSPVTR